MFTTPQALRRKGILGMNLRNVGYIARYNDRRLYPLVDDKLQTKMMARLHKVPTPELRLTVRSQHQIKQFEEKVKNLSGFAIKPAKGAGGKGILIIERRKDDLFIKPSGATLTLADVSRHLSNILAGLHSLGGTPDVALVEDLIKPVAFFKELSYEGVPDIRIIIFRGIPVMAMLRLATHASDGKANLHQGAIGVGLDLATGRCVHAVQYGRRITHHPDTNADLSAIVIPDWVMMMTLAAECHELTGLGYLGADLVVDENRGPLMLELNARPGLAIQVANGAGLLPRLQRVESLELIPRNPAERVAFAMQHFCRTPMAEIS
ncbi:MAG: alpha-L-glutamate ligase-like protein [Halomonadaceae bacterium]|nr:MAG: alpha-L-glutamate ligase-like protein [Halomonadaceae bacterium]